MTDGARPPRTVVLRALLAFQAVCAAFFLFDIAASVFGLTARPIAWNLHEAIQLGAVLGLLAGTVATALALRLAERRRREAEARLQVASGAFHALIEARFEEWGLTPAERDVALFSLKGLSLAEIAALRGTSEGTVKAQSAAVYRKAGVSGRAALLGLFVEALMDEALLPGPVDAPRLSA